MTTRFQNLSMAVGPNGRQIVVSGPGNANANRQRVTNQLKRAIYEPLRLNPIQERQIVNAILKNRRYNNRLNLPIIKFAIANAIPANVRKSLPVQYMRVLINAQKTAMANRARNLNLHPLVINLGQRINAHRFILQQAGIRM